jgi:hypothetical protein
LPHHLQTTGVGWLVAAVVSVVLSLLVFVGGLHGLAVDITVIDAGMVEWVAGLQAPGLLAAMQGLAALDSYLAITVLLWGLLLALLVLRRLRQLLVVLLAWMLQGFLIQYLLAPLMQRPRPFGVELRATGTPGHCPPSRWRRWWSSSSGSCTAWCRRAAGARPASG